MILHILIYIINTFSCSASLNSKHRVDDNQFNIYCMARVPVPNTSPSYRSYKSRKIQDLNIELSFPIFISSTIELQI